MLRDKAKVDYDKLASQVANGRIGYIPAKKSKYSKSANNRFGSAPLFM